MKTPFLSRRTMLQGLLLLAACGGDDAAPQAGGEGAAGQGGAGMGGAAQAGAGQGGAGKGGEAGQAPMPGGPFDVWRELQAAVRESPDHLRFEAERVVASKDAAAIFAFVQGSFATRPLLGTSLSADPRYSFGWGRRGVLRSGSGTPRDKAELLRELFVEAGFEATVVDGHVDAGYWARVFAHKPERAFAPALPEGRLEMLRGVLGLGAPMQTEVIDEKGDEAAALADMLIGLLPPDRKAGDMPGLDATSAPFVRVKVDGKTLVCDPNDPSSSFEGGPLDMGLSVTGEGKAAGDRLSITLSMVTTVSPSPVELVKGDYEVADVVGRTVQVAMVPPGGIDAVLLSALRDVRTFAPVLAVSGPDMSDDEREALVRSGKSFTLGGDVVEVMGDSASVNGVALEPSSGEVDAALLSRVATLTVSASGGSFPQVGLRVTALDESGAEVGGLPGASFFIEEDGVRVGASMTENKSRPPRVVFVLDKSESIPDEFRGEPAAAALRDIAAAIKQAIPGSTFNVFAVSSSPDPKKFTEDPEALYADALAATTIFGSDLWDAMAKASDLSPTFVVLITDGDSTDEPTLKMTARASRIPASMALKVGTVDPAELSAVARVSNGQVLPIEQIAKAKELVIDALKASFKASYAMSYLADEAGPLVRTVTVSLGKGKPSQMATYEVPAPSARVVPARLAGLLLTVKHGGEEVTRLLAGVAKIDDALDPRVFDEAALACFGSIQLRLEGEPATPSALLDELVSARLSAEPFVTAAREGDVPGALDAFSAGFDRPEAITLGLASIGSARGNGEITGSGLRGVLTVLTPTLGKTVVLRSDVLPIGPLRSIEADRKAAFDEAIRASTRIAIAEEGLHLDSTRARLDGKKLVYLRPYAGIDEAVKGLSPEQQRAWQVVLDAYNPFHRAVPEDGDLVGFYAVHERTGFALGVLPDGSGGSATRDQIEKDMAWMVSLMNWVGAVGGAFAIIGVVGGAWLALEKAKLKKIIQATIAISTLEGVPGSDGFQDSIKDVACDILKGVAGELFGRLVKGGVPALKALGVLGAATTNSDALIEAVIGKAPIECF